MYRRVWYAMEARKQMQTEKSAGTKRRTLQKKNSFMLWNWDGRINDVKGVKIDAECQEPGDLETRQELK